MRKDIAAIILVLGVSLYFFAVKVVDIKEKETSLVAVQERLTALKAAGEQVELLQKSIEALEAKLPELEQSLPKEADLDRIVKTFSTFASSAGLQINSISSKASNQGGGKDIYRVWEVTLSGGTLYYENVLKFLGHLKDMKRAFSPERVAVRYNNGWEKKGQGRLLLEMKLKTFIRR